MTPISIGELKKAIKRGEPFEFIPFYVSVFSNWYPAIFEEDGIIYPTSEHYMMAKKAELFEDSFILKQILDTENPGVAKVLGRHVSNFNIKIWRKHRFDIVAQGAALKFVQNHELKLELQATKGKILVEASPVDRIWGVGLDKSDKKVHDPFEWRGKNLLGFALIRARQLIRSTTWRSKNLK